MIALALFIVNFACDYTDFFCVIAIVLTLFETLFDRLGGEYFLEFLTENLPDISDSERRNVRFPKFAREVAPLAVNHGSTLAIPPPRFVRTRDEKSVGTILL